MTAPAIRRSIRRLTPRLCVLAFALGAAVSPMSKAAAAARPNVVVILVDDLGYGDLNLGLPGTKEAFRNPHVRTPNLARLARQSLVFTHHYAAHATCSPSRAGLLTGRIPTRLGIHQWIDDLKDNDKTYLGGDEVTIAEQLKTIGYQTAVFGKWHLNGADWEVPANWTGATGSFPRQQGFDDGFVSKENPHLSRRLLHNSQKNPGDFFRVDGTPLDTMKGYSSEIITSASLDWMAKKRDSRRPFFLYLPYDAVHETIFNPDKFDAMYNTGNPRKDQYYANITHLDAEIGRLLRGIDQMGLGRDTMVVFSSDNGPDVLSAATFTDRSYGTSYPLRGEKRQILEGGIRVPGMIRWPGQITPGISSEPNSTLDLLPTLAALTGAGLPPNRTLDGADLSDHLLKRGSVRRHQPLYWQIEMNLDWVTTGEGYDRRYDGLRKREPVGIPGAAVREGDYVVRGLHAGSPFTLPKTYVMYDVAHDIEEQKELSKADPERFARLVASLKRIHGQVNAERVALENRRAVARPQVLIGHHTRDYKTFEVLKQSGFDYTQLGLGKLSGMAESDRVALRDRLRAIGLPAVVGVMDIPAKVRLNGPGTDPKAQMQVFQAHLDAARALDIKMVVLGGSKARHVPDGFSRDLAFKQIVEVSRVLAIEAEKRGLLVLFEPLTKERTNFLNSIADGIALVRAVNHPNFKLDVDLYHMYVAKEDPEVLIKAGRHLGLVEISNPDGRGFPAPSDGYDYGRFLTALHKAGYTGPLTIDVKEKSDESKEASPSVRFVRAAAKTANLSTR